MTSPNGENCEPVSSGGSAHSASEDKDQASMHENRKLPCRSSHWIRGIDIHSKFYFDCCISSESSDIELSDDDNELIRQKGMSYTAYRMQHTVCRHDVVVSGLTSHKVIGH